jgi:predicted anti-sigma-YlaC factor YlaD
MLSCEKVTELCSQELERQLGIRERAAIQAHLMMCSGCTNFRKQMKILRRITHAYADGQAESVDSIDPSPKTGIGP